MSFKERRKQMMILSAARNRRAEALIKWSQVPQNLLLAAFTAKERNTALAIADVNEFNKLPTSKTRQEFVGAIFLAFSRKRSKKKKKLAGQNITEFDS